MLYTFYEMQHAAVAPLRVLAGHGRDALRHPWNPAAYTAGGRLLAAGWDMLEYATRRYERPDFGLRSTVIDGTEVAVEERVAMATPFCELRHFRRETVGRRDPRVLIVAPLSGHFATLLRGTVAAMLPDHEVYITDWRDAREVPLTAGGFDLDDNIGVVADCLRAIGPGAHVMAVCQPSVPVLAAVALMAAAGDAATPASMVLMGGPIDTRVNPTEVNRFAVSRPIDWFARNLIARVPGHRPGAGRSVYPGFVQLAGFLGMNFDRHLDAHWRMFLHLAAGDGDSAEARRAFYDEYRAVMDLTAEFYLQTVKTVFQDHALPRGEMMSRGRRVEPAAIAGTALMTVEGERDDISGLGQTRAAHELCVTIPADRHAHWEVPGVGHYGIFNGRRWRTEIAPRIKAFIAAHDDPDHSPPAAAERGGGGVGSR